MCIVNQVKGRRLISNLPRHYGESTEIQMMDRETTLQGGSETILLVEDEPMTP